MTAKSIFETNAAEIRELSKAAKVRDEGPEQRQAWLEATQRLQVRYDKLAFPGGLERQTERLKKGDGNAIELAVQFLEADPWFHRSGYIKESLIRVLKKAPLSDTQCARLRDALLAKVDAGRGREFRDYCRLARRLKTEELVEQLAFKAESQDERVAQRARWMLEALEE